MKISIYIATSANGFISNSRNVPDWLSPEYGAGFASICEQKNAVIMGKTTYNILAPDYLPLKTKGTTIVLTTDEKVKSDNPTVVFTKSKAREIVELLSRKGHEEAVIIGGNQTMTEFIKAGLVDDVFLIMEPTLFGNGLPLIQAIPEELKLKLLDVKNLNGNTVQLHYKIENRKS